MNKISALEKGNITEAVVATQPISGYEDALEKLINCEKQYTTLFEETTQVIDKQAVTDQELANYFN